MPKSSINQIKLDEKRVIKVLQNNSKESIDNIAKKSGFSRQKVWRIIKRLEKNKTIWGYHAVIEEEKIDMKSFILLIKGKRLPIGNPSEEYIIERTIDKIGEKIGIIVEDSIWLHGEYDWVMSFLAKDLKTAKKFNELFSKQYLGNISELKLMEKIITVKKDGFINPKISKGKKLLD